jgi:hypothetical protein
VPKKFDYVIDADGELGDTGEPLAVVRWKLFGRFSRWKVADRSVGLGEGRFENDEPRERFTAEGLWGRWRRSKSAV